MQCSNETSMSWTLAESGIERVRKILELFFSFKATSSLTEDAIILSHTPKNS